jgi:hypothetical protein
MTTNGGATGKTSDYVDLGLLSLDRTLVPVHHGPMSDVENFGAQPWRP